MICPSCQHENREDAKFCDECGGKLEVVCPQCSRVNRPEAKFCDGCGHDLRKPKEAPVINYNEPQSYTPKHLADKILTSRSAIEGERKLVTVLFADVAGFTPMSEKLDPEDVHEIMDGCFRILMDEIHRYEGTVNEFRGDGLMALFGAPVSHEDHAQRACHAALAAQKALVPYAEKLHREYGIDFKIRIGLNSGPVVVGSIGDDLRMDYTAQGDTANLAARMESNAEPGEVLVSEHTYKVAGRFFDFDPRGEIQVKGKAEPVEAYRLIKPSEAETRIEASAAKGLTRFVGRKREFETLKEAFEKARSGEGQVVGVVGEAGVGKSRLLLEFRKSIPKGEYIYLEGRCLHYGSSMPYLPILDALRTYLGIKGGERESVIKDKMMERIVGTDENLRRCLPPIQELFSIGVDDEQFAKLEPKQKREKTFEALRDILIRGSQTRPMVLAIEDLHWIDRTTEELLDYMIGWLPSSHILLILLYRPEYTHQWGSKSYYAQIGVGQLSIGTSAELVKAILEGGEVAPELRELILSRTSGNPLFMEELTHTLLENGSIVRKGDRYVFAGPSSEIAVPDTIHGIIASRMDRLEENLKRIMQVASVIGREFAFRILETITEMKDDLKSNLLNLQGLEFIYEKSLFPELEYIFRHALTQEVAYNSLLLKRRKQIHERIGQAIETLYPDRLEEFYEMLAYHYSKSENAVKACHYLKLAANKATRNSSLSEAISLYKQAYTLLCQMADTEDAKREQIRLILLMSIPLRMLGYPDDSIDILHHGERLCEELNDHKNLVNFHSTLGLYYSNKGQPLRAQQYQETYFEQIDEIEDVELMVPVAYDLGLSFMFRGEYVKVADLAPKVLSALERRGKQKEFFGRPPNMYSIFYGWYGMVTAFMGDFTKGERLLEKALYQARQIDHIVTLGIVEHQYGIVLLYKGDGESAHKHLRNGISFYEKAKAVLYLGAATAFSGYAYYLKGDTKNALKSLEKGIKIHTDQGLPFWLSSFYWFLTMVHCDQGDLQEARLYAERAVELAQQNNEKHAEAGSRIVLGRVLGKIDSSQFNEVEDLILQGIELSDQLRYRITYPLGRLFLGELYAHAGQKEEALENLKTAESMFQEMGMDYWLGKAQEVLAKL